MVAAPATSAPRTNTWPHLPDRALISAADGRDPTAPDVIVLRVVTKKGVAKKDHYIASFHQRGGAGGGFPFGERKKIIVGIAAVTPEAGRGDVAVRRLMRTRVTNARKTDAEVALWGTLVNCGAAPQRTLKHIAPGCDCPEDAACDCRRSGFGRLCVWWTDRFPFHESRWHAQAYGYAYYDRTGEGVSCCPCVCVCVCARVCASVCARVCVFFCFICFAVADVSCDVAWLQGRRTWSGRLSATPPATFRFRPSAARTRAHTCCPLAAAAAAQPPLSALPWLAQPVGLL